MSILSNEIRKKRQKEAGKETSPLSGTGATKKTEQAGETEVSTPSALRSAILTKRAGGSIGDKGLTVSSGSTRLPTVTTAKKTASPSVSLRSTAPSPEGAVETGEQKTVRGGSFGGSGGTVSQKGGFGGDRESAYGKADWGKIAKGTVMQGADQVAKQVSATGAMLEGAALKVGHKLLTGDTLTDEDVAQMGLLNALDKRIDQGTEKNQAYFQPEYDKGGKIGQAVGKYGAATVAALPQAALAFVTAGQSLAAAQTTAGLQAASSAAGAGIAQTVNTLLKDTATDPGFLYSLVSTMGGEYQQAKADGADDAHAYAYAALTGVLNSLVEVGGGIDQLPDGSKKAVRQWVETMLDEGKEEVIQGAISQLAQNAVYGKGNVLASATDEDAVLSAKRAVEEFIGGAVVGGILGGGQIAIQSGVDRMYDRARAQTQTDTEADQTAQEAGLNVREGMSKSQQRETAKSAVDTLAQRRQAAETLEGYPTLQQLERGEPVTDANTAALEAMDAMEKGIISRERGRELVRQAAETARSQEQQTGQEQQVLQRQTETAGEGAVDTQTMREATGEGPLRQPSGPTPLPEGGASGSPTAASASAESRAPGFYGTADKADAQYLDRLAKAAGVTMEQVSSQEAGQRQGWAIDGRIYLSEQTEDPLRMVARHEITHRIQEMAADSYSEYRGYVEEVYRQAGTLDESVRMRQELYRKNGQELTYDQALDELAADYAGELLVNEQLIDRLAQGKPSLARRVLDAIRDVVARLKQKLSRSEVEPLEQAARLWEQALRDANRAYWQNSQSGGTVDSPLRQPSGLPPLPEGEASGERSAAPMTAQAEKVSYTLTEEAGRDRMEKTTRQEDDHRGERLGERGSADQRDSAGPQAENGDRPGVQETIRGVQRSDRQSASPEEIHQARGLIEKAARDYHVPVGFIQAESWPTGHEAHAAYSSEGKIYVREGVDPAVASEVIPHEVTHVMKQTEFQPYMDLLEKTTDMMDWENEDARKLLNAAAEHRGIDLFSMSGTDMATLYDEINAIVSGGIMSGQDAQIRERLENAFYDYDLYREEVERIHREFQGRGESQNAGETGTQTAKRSVKGTRALQKQVEALTRQNQRLKEQLKRTDTVKASRKAVEQQAGELKKAYQSKIDRAALADRMDSLYTKMGQLGSEMEGGTIVTEEDIRAEARGIAEDILTESRANVNPKAEEYADLRKELRGRRLYLAEEYRADLDSAGGYTEFRKRNMGSLTLSTKGTAVDVAYQELSDRYPNLFPDDIYHPADQLMQIGEVAQGLKRVEGNPYEQELEYTTQYLAGELMERFYDTPSAKPTLADRMEQRYQSQRLKDRQANRQRLEKQQAEYKQRLEEMEDSYREKNRKRIEGQNTSQRRETIRRHAERLGRKLVRPTDTQHVPESFRGAALAFVKYLDLGSSYEMAYGADGKYYRVELGGELGAEPTSRTLAAAQLQKEYAKLEEAGYAVDPMMEAYLEEIGKLGNKRVADMSRSELDTVWTVMQVLEHAISKENDRLGESRYRTVSDLAETLRRDNGQKEDRGSYAGLKGKADDLLNLDMLEPVTFFSRMGEAGEDIYRQMRKAADRQTEIIREGTDRARQLVEDNDISFKKLDGELHTFDLTDGKLTLSTSQLMELYALSKREQAQEHIYLGGLKPRNAVDKKGKIVESSRAVHVTPVEVAEMLDTLTAEQKSLMDGLRDYLSGDLAKHGNRASMDVYGYEKFKEKNYWPIKVSGNETQSDAGSKAKAKTIPGYGMTKTTQPHAKNAVELRSALDSFCTHLNQMSTYAAWLNTNENLTRLENYQFQDKNGNTYGTMKGLLEKVYGKGGQTYYENLLQDIAQGTKAGADPSLTGKMISNWKAAKVGANLRVVIQQPTAVLRAMSMVDPKYFAVAQDPLKGWAEAKEHCPIAQWKDWGYFETGTGRSLRELVTGAESALDWTRNASGAWAGGADAVGWGHLWNAVKAEVTAENKALTVKSEAWWQAVSDRFSEVVDKTQVVDSVMHRSQIMRSSDGATKKITAFQSEPTKIYNMVLRDIYAAKSADGKAARRATAKAIRRDVAALVTSFAVNAAAQSFMDAMRDDDRDKEFGEKFWDSYLGRSDEDAGRLEKAMGVIGGNFASNFNLLTYIPVVKEMWSVAEGYTLGSSDLEGLEDAVLGVKAVIDKAQGKGQKSWLYTGLDAACKAADLVGLPASNLRRDAGAIFRTAMQSAGAGDLLYEWDKLKYDPETAMGIYQNDLYRAMDSDWDLYEKIYGEIQTEQVEQLRREAGAEGETPTDEELEARAAQKTKTAMENRMKKELGITSAENLPYRYSAPGENEAFDGYLKERIKSRSDWVELPEEVEKLVRELEDQDPEKTERVLMIAGSGMEESWAESFLRNALSGSEWERYDYCREEGVTMQEWADAYAAIAGAHYQRTGKRGSAAKADAETALGKLQGLTNKKRTAIWNSYVETGVWKSESPWG